MSTLRDRTRSYIDEHRLDGKDFAKFAGVSGSSLSRFLKHGKAGYAVRHKIDAALDGHGFVEEEECVPDALAELTERVESLRRGGRDAFELHSRRYDMLDGHLKSHIANATRIQDGLLDRVRNSAKERDILRGMARLQSKADRKRLNRAMVVGTLMWLGLLVFVIVK